MPTGNSENGSETEKLKIGSGRQKCKRYYITHHGDTELCILKWRLAI